MIVDKIYDWARTQPHRPAIIHNDTVISYLEFASRINATCSFFQAYNLPVGRTAVVIIDNLADSWIVTLSLRMFGLTTICVSSMESAAALTIRDVACVVVTQAEQATVRDNSSMFPGAFRIVVPADLKSDAEFSTPPEFSAPFGSHILYTSGTTGVYKKVFFSGELSDQRDARLVKNQSIREYTVHHAINFSPWMSAGFVSITPVWSVGGCIIFDQTDDIAERFFKRDIDKTFLVASMLPSLIYVARARQYSPRNMLIMVGGGFLSASNAKDISTYLSNRIWISYGSTECTNIMKSMFTEDDDIHWSRPLEDRTVVIFNDDGDECQVGEEGRLGVKLLDVDADRYLDDPETSARFFVDGYFYPGDMAVRRADGRIRVLGRVADVLNVKGTKLTVAPFEAQIQSLLRIENVCLFGGLDDQGAAELVIALQTAQLPPRAELERVVQMFDQLFDKVRFEVLKEFPRTETGMRKIKRTELRKMVVRNSGGG